MTTGHAWLEPEAAEIDGWPVRGVELPAVGVAVAVPQAWSAPATTDEPPATMARITGALPGEGLVVARIGNATSGRDIGDWLQLPMSATGGLDPQTMATKGTSEVLQWQRSDTGELAARFGTDELVAHDGLAKYLADPDDPPELVHSYVVLARRGDTAWKVALTLSSACLPGTPDDVVDANDHVRARACLGRLRFG